MESVTTVPIHIPEGVVPWGLKACIAGGYAADPTLADDIDVWIFAADAIEMVATRQRVLDFLFNQRGLEFTEEEGFRKEGADAYSRSMKVARVTHPDYTTQTIHIMVTTCTSELDLVSGFDISTHAIAVTDEGEVVKSSRWTPTTVEPAVMKMTATTPERLKKISARYAHLRGV
jgi:hypothetical protein